MLINSEILNQNEFTYGEWTLNKMTLTEIINTTKLIWNDGNCQNDINGITSDHLRFSCNNKEAYAKFHNINFYL